VGARVTEPLKWYDEKDDHPPWIKALAEVRSRATREGWCYPHVQAIIVAIHVNDGDVSSATFVNFAAKHFSEGARGTGYRVASTLAKAWQLAATRDGFTDLTNPFDAGLDRVAPAPKRHAKSTRRALDQVVRAIVLRENRRDDFAFARQHEGQSNLCWYKLRNQETGRHEFVFFPLVPILINVILNSGMRRSSARWLDSGEGDEFAVDVETRKEIPNPLTSAIKLRREGFIKLFEFIDGDGRRRELGMYLNPYVICARTQ
jgi:hypothetical protein